MERFTVRLRDDQRSVLRELSRVSVARRDTPDMTEAAIARELLDLALSGEGAHLRGLVEEVERGDHDDDQLADILLDLVPEHVRVEHKRELIKERNRVADLRGGFRGRVAQEIRRRFESGYSPEALREVAEGYRAEARLLWPADAEARQAAEDHVNAEVAAAIEASETSDLDPASTDYESYGGVEEAEAEADPDELAEDAERLLREHSPVVVVRKLSRRAGVSEETAREVVEEATGRLRRLANDESEEDER